MWFTLLTIALIMPALASVLLFNTRLENRRPEDSDIHYPGL
jgi:hypothetical protein